jgi:NADP-dependent 3-hydroxy acid dehydrogenase YdfG
VTSEQWHREATARALASHGAAVALVARRTDRLEKLAADIEAGGGKALVIEGDVTDRGQATDAVNRAASELGRLDTVVNNAGVMLLGPVEGAPLEEWQRMVSLNVMGLLYVAHAAAAAPAAGGRERAATSIGPGEHQLGGRAYGAGRYWRVQPD